LVFGRILSVHLDKKADDSAASKRGEKNADFQCFGISKSNELALKHLLINRFDAR
jgi:hypothetical protein